MNSDLLRMNEEFFDIVSSYYDDMIGFEAALDRRTEALRNIISPDYKNAADFGCGTGLDSISLNRLGLKVSAFDISPGMIAEAELNARKYAPEIRFHNISVTAVPESFYNSFDVAVSLGNTISNIPFTEISAAVNKLYAVLKSGGRLVIQVLNYSALREKNERILNITHKDDTYFIRFYDFLENHINFNILKFNSGNSSKRSLVTTPLYPYTQERLITLLLTNNFRNVASCGSLAMEAFDKKTSRDLVLSAYK